MAYQAIETRNDGAVAWLTLNRPHNLNALSALMVEELEDYLRVSAFLDLMHAKARYSLRKKK